MVMVVAFARASLVKVEIYRDMKVCICFRCIIFTLKRVFPLLYSQRTRQTTYISPRTMKITSKAQSEHAQSLYYMNS